MTCKCCGMPRELGPVDPSLCGPCYNYVSVRVSEAARDRFALSETVKLLRGLVLQCNAVLAKAPTDL